MNAERDTARLVRSWLRTDEHESPDRVLDAVLDQLDRTPQRRGMVWRARTILAMNGGAALATAIGAVVIVALLGLQFLAGGERRIGTDGQPMPSPSATAARPFPSGSVALSPGRYAIGHPYPVELTFEVPGGFDACSSDPLEPGVCARTNAAAGLSFVIVENLVEDPCDLDPVPADPSIGPTVDDLVQGFAELPYFSATSAQSAMVDGRPGRSLTLTAPLNAACPGGRFSGETWIVSPTRTNAVGAGERNELFIADVQGQRLMIAIAYQPNTPTWAVDAMRDILATVRFGP